MYGLYYHEYRLGYKYSSSFMIYAGLGGSVSGVMYGLYWYL